MRKFLFSLFFCALALGTTIAAESNLVRYGKVPSQVLTIFREIYEPQSPELQLPKPVKIVLPVQNFGIAIVEKESGAVQPWQKIRQTASRAVELAVAETSALIGAPGNLVDGESETFAEFDLDADDGAASVTLESTNTLTSTQLRLILAANVALPHEIEISAWVDEKWKTVLARSRMSEIVVNFPENSAREWRVKFWHAQPLRVAELRFVDVNSRSFEIGEEYIWLARPGENYLIYSNAAGSARIAVGESGNLLNDLENILEIPAGTSRANPSFAEPDSDADGIANIFDNCVSLANPEQTDLDANGRGDACEDHDRDGVMDDRDNCASFANRNQKDTDGDGIGDACDDAESRLTEKLPWLPWVAIGGVAIVIIFVILQTIHGVAKKEEE